MNKLQCDILIIGAGPAGSSSAFSAASRGLDVVVVERRKKIGVPVRCAEYIPAPLLGEINLKKNVIVQPIKGMRTWLPSGDVVETKAPGFTINRDIFDQTLALAAKQAGAQLLLSATAMRHHNGKVRIKKQDDTFLEILPRVIIGADGPYSRVGRWINSNKNLIPAIQVRVLLTAPMEYTQVYFQKDFYGGYGWLFPKKNEANIGLARKRKKEGDVSLQFLLAQFMNRLIKEGKILPGTIKKFGGVIPAESVRSVTRQNILLVGDAAGHTHPITGAGVAQAVICGKMAGYWASKAIEKDDLSLLREYETEWTEMFGRTIQHAYARRSLMEQKWDRLEDVIKKCWIAFKAYYE